jgi:hypothetical protein
VDVELKLVSGVDHVCSLELWGAVVPAESTVSYRPSKVELKLKKALPGGWAALERAATVLAPVVTAAVAAAPAEAPKPKYPSSSAKGVNWDEVEKVIAQEEAAETPEGEEALHKLFKQIYGNADEDTRRAMVKSFQTSGGTVLSTNWKEVGTKDYEKERQAPDGMTWKKWG